MHPYLLAFIAVIAGALDGIIFRHTMKRGACPWATLIFFHFVAVVFFIPFVSLSAITEVTNSQFLILLGSCFLWLIGDLYSVKALEYLDATVCELYGALGLILVTLSGVVLFSETITGLALVGVLLIVASVLYQMNFDAFTINRGTCYQFIGVLFCTGALVLDKYLTELVSEQTIVFYGFLLPALLYLGIGWKRVPNILPALKKSNYFFLLAPVLGVISYFCIIKAFATGQLSVTHIIQQTGIVFVFLFEVVLLRVYDNFSRRAFACAICAIGAACVCGAL